MSNYAQQGSPDPSQYPYQNQEPNGADLYQYQNQAPKGADLSVIKSSLAEEADGLSEIAGMLEELVERLFGPPPLSGIGGAVTPIAMKGGAIGAVEEQIRRITDSRNRIATARQRLNNLA